MTPEVYEELRRLMKNHRICFMGPVTQDQWPSAYRPLFANIQRLGQLLYEEYTRTRQDRAVYEPWGADVLERAARVVAKAERCRSERRNKAGWRLALEGEILNRFTVEVAWYF